MRFRCYVFFMFLLLPALPTKIYASQLTQLESGKVVFSFSLEAFQQAWQTMNQILSAPYEKLDFSAIQSVPSRGRFVETFLDQQTKLVLYLDQYEEYITSMALMAPRPKSNFEQILLSNMIAMLLNLIDHEVERSVFHQLTASFTNNQRKYIFITHHDLFYISFTNSNDDFILNISPKQKDIFSTHS